MQIPPYLLNEHYNDRYFDVVDAFEEARHIHLSGSRVEERVREACRNGEEFRIGETGFGAGRVLAALIDTLEACENLNYKIHYSSVELYPLSIERMKCVLEGFRDRADSHIQKMCEAYSRLDISKPGWHQAAIKAKSGIIELRLFAGEALDMILSLDAPCDAWFLDGHGPKKNPDIWRTELLSAIGAKTVSGGTVTTYTVAGHVRRDLAAAGFSLEKVCGFGGKKEVLRGEKLAAGSEDRITADSTTHR
ncbi:MAG: tRNA (5-methylaminomethyl-2-thiouridine)(34)-methyltransferase MnmD [Chitinispirillales bacterium]|jgi:tRNA 5-methylaminomethyl-2-thiouridine biosynthesis bifunctional protein|nr:tRNA (5-methylaminomethyl-2-thiouridine)(34)-methyltransferase MnmD [Chitinispirillales bacterium]